MRCCMRGCTRGLNTGVAANVHTHLPRYDAPPILGQQVGVLVDVLVEAKGQGGERDAGAAELPRPTYTTKHELPDIIVDDIACKHWCVRVVEAESSIVVLLALSGTLNHHGRVALSGTVGPAVLAGWGWYAERLFEPAEQHHKYE